MLPCLRTGYHQAICDFKEFFEARKDVPHEPWMAIMDKLIQMMNNKRNIDWEILREEQGAAIDEVIAKRKDNPTDGR